MYKIVGADGKEYGPVNVEQMRRWLAENRVRGDTLAQADGSADWKPLSSFPEFASEFKAPPPFSGSPPTMTPLPPLTANRAATKIPAGICGILLGSLGIHKFILGNNGAGVIMLVITLVGGVFTCGAAAGVMHIIGLIEGIIYLTKSDDEFVRTYVDSRKEWF